MPSSVTPPVWKYRGCHDHGNDHDPEKVDMGRRSEQGSGNLVFLGGFWGRSGSTASGCGTQRVRSVLHDQKLLGYMSCDKAL